MKYYNVENYVRYKQEVLTAVKRLPKIPVTEYSDEQLNIKFLPLVENLARKFSTTQQASGVMSIMDMI